MVLTTYRPEGSILSLPENRAYLASEEGLQRAADSGIILEAMALRCDSDYRLTVDLGCMKGYIPREEVLFQPNGEGVRDIAVITRVGKAVCFKVMGFYTVNGKRVAHLSRKEAQRECYDAFLCGSVPGDILEAKVTHLENFGAFVDVGCGIVSLLSIDCISVSRISHPSDRFRVGDRIRVVVRSIDRETGRLFVTHKELLGTWEENVRLFSVGQTVAGIVRSVEEYGIFVELTPNLAGLAEFRPDIAVGQTAAVYIKSIIPEKMKIKLIIIDSRDIPISPEPLEYFIDTSTTTHIDSWTYSPKSCKRTIESIF